MSTLRTEITEGYGNLTPTKMKDFLKTQMPSLFLIIYSFCW